MRHEVDAGCSFRQSRAAPISVEARRQKTVARMGLGVSVRKATASSLQPRSTHTSDGSHGLRFAAVGRSPGASPAGSMQRAPLLGGLEAAAFG